MKSILIFFVAILPWGAFADLSTPEQLARSFAAAVQAKDTTAIKKLIHPKFVKSLDADETKLLDGWVRSEIDNASQIKDPMQIDCKTLNSKQVAEMSTDYKWYVQPEVQIEMQCFQKSNADDSEETNTFADVEWAAKYQTNYYFVFRLPADP
jgi:uncharacterized membrane protein YvbJ